MRQTSDAQIVLTASNQHVRAICFGYDYCAEQEVGVPFMKLFTQPDERSIVRTPEGFGWVEIDGYQGLYYYPCATVETVMERMSKTRFSLREPNQPRHIISAWSDQGFMFLVRTSKDIRLLRDFFEEILAGRTTFFSASKIKGTGLCIAVSRLVTAELAEMAREDQERQEAQAAFDKTKAKRMLDKLQEKARKAGRSCYQPTYMGPSRGGVFNDNGERLYWLNATDHYGWLTDQQLCDYLQKLERQVMG